MTTPENSTGTPTPSLSGLATFNLGIGLIASVLLVGEVFLSLDSRVDGLEKTALIFPIFVVLLSVASAMFSIWHGNIGGDKADFKKAIGLTSWILTFVTLGFGAMMLLLVLIVVFRL